MSDIRQLIAQELHWTLRSLQRNPRRSILIVAVLSLALATNAVMLGVLDELFLSTSPLIRQPERIVRISKAGEIAGRGRVVQERLAYPDFAALAERAPGINHVAGSFMTSISIGEGPESFRTTVAFVTSSYLRLLGVGAAIGRGIADAEDVPPQGELVVVLSHSFWRRQFGGDSGVVGRVMRIGNNRFTVIGVLPPGFRGPDREPVDLWMPLSVAGSQLYGSAWDFNSNVYWIETFARLTPGTQIQTLARRINQTLLGERQTGRRTAEFVVAPLNRARGPDRPIEARVALWLGGVAAVVLLIACANIGNMQIVNGMERRTEFAVRLALGGTRGRLAFNMFAEALSLSIASGGVAILIGASASQLVLPHIMGATARTSGMDLRLFSTMLGLTLLVAVITAMWPISRLRDANIESVLRGASSTRNRAGTAGRFTLLATQIGLTTVLLCGAGLFLRSFRAVSDIDAGFDPDRVVVIDLDAPNNETPRVLEQKYAMVQRALHADPLVQRTAIGATAPFLSGVAVRVEIPGHDSLPADNGGVIYVNAVTSDFFATLGLRVTKGRVFEPVDPGGKYVSVVSQHFAETIWHGENPLGKCIHVYSRKGPCLVVIGVIADPKRDKIGEEPVSQFFVPLEVAPGIAKSRLLFARVRGAPDEAAVRITRAILRTLPNAGHPRVQPLSTMVARQRRPWSLGATLFGAFSGLALIIACLGLYNVIFHDVKARERELAIRVTLGAGAWDVARSVLARTGGAALVGLAVGLAAGSWMGTRIEPLLFRTAGIDPLIDASIVVVTLVIAIFAAIGPLRRAVAVQPAVVLRES